eukprot:TRINITY_DN5425_c0_g2_i3.p1 TRINITY_DN5425_c0_g2~~TRINITY_DN5425_c0_g2_i3.p1  ORF type:complete len:186 (-),score=16.35 TRINITY_DN5425_c0_g2_i3:49-606(-)
MSQWPEQSECCNPPADVGTCCLSWWCPCVIAGQNAEKGGVGSCLSVGLRTGIPFALIPIISVLAEVVRTMMLISAFENDTTAEFEAAMNQRNIMTGVFGMLSLLVTAVFAGANIMNRQAIAKTKGYDPSPCPACFCYFCGCHCMPLMQEWKVVNGASAPVAGAVIGQPVAVTGQVVELGNEKAPA